MTRKPRVRLADVLQKNNRGDQPAGTVAVESDWLEVGTLEVTTGSLWAGDPCVCNGEDGCVVKVPRGKYLVLAKSMDFAGRKRVSGCASSFRRPAIRRSANW